ncbi:hypothetical protein N7523_000969 [Penicillium sp. IBT 18751x]|nr:hypothetical protein N7523_000969 [Penicillium sp. IBT 18751x]
MVQGVHVEIRFMTSYLLPVRYSIRRTALQHTAYGPTAYGVRPYSVQSKIKGGVLLGRNGGFRYLEPSHIGDQMSDRQMGEH